MSASQDLSPTERYDLATKLITQSPPGQVNDVIAAIQVIVDDHSPEFKAQVLLRLGEYHRSQLQNHTISGSNRATLISGAACLSKDESRYIDPNTSTSYALDHFTMTASEIQPHSIRPDFESFRSQLDTALTTYLGNHYSTSESFGSVVCSARPAKVREIVQQSTVVEDEKNEGDEEKEGENEEGLAVGSPTEEIKSEPTVPAEGPLSSTEPNVPVPSDPTSTTDSTETTPANPPSTGIINTLESAIVETVEQVKEAINAETPSAALGTRESGGAVVDDSEKITATGGDVEEDKEKAIEPVGAEEKSATGDEAVTDSKVEPETTTTTAPAQPVVPDTAEPEFEDEDPKYTVHIVSNKYNTKNFWTGRWRSIWTIDPAQKNIHGEIHVDVHYFEAGNVQLATNQSFDLPLPASVEKDQPGASKMINAIAQLEAEYQLKLGETNQQFADKEFRSLRRALPITRSRMDWDKVSAYRLRSKAT